MCSSDLGFEDAMLQVREQYELRSKKSQDTTKTKTPEITVKKRPDKTSKATSVNNKTVAESSGRHKEKDSQDNAKQIQPTSSTSTSVSTPDTTVPNPCYSIISHLDMIHDCFMAFGHPFLQTWTNSLKNSVKSPIRDYARDFPRVYASPSRIFHVCH